MEEIIKQLLKNTFLYKKYKAYKERKNFKENFLYDWDLALKYNGDFSTENDQVKFQHKLRIAEHAIEKGLSFRNPKPSFGIPRIEELLDRLQSYFDTYEDAHFTSHCLDTIAGYIERYHSDPRLGLIKQRYKQLQEKVNSEAHISEGVKLISKDEVDFVLKKTDFAAFLNSRHSYRYFSPEDVSNEVLECAFKMAESTPTACNRQLQHVYILSGKDIKKMLEMQAGCRGFIEEINRLLIITTDVRGYFSQELKQAYVDGGLYSMNLLLCLHSQGLGTIPLTMGGFSGKRRNELSVFGIPEYETPIIMIGVGNREKETRTNLSARKSYKSYVNWV